MTDYPHDPLPEKSATAGNSLERTLAKKKAKRRELLERIQRQRSQALPRITRFLPQPARLERNEGK
jgi:hypothetical protein